MEDLEQVYESEELFPLFANRLLSRSRPDYEEFLTWGGFDPSSTPDPISILGVHGRTTANGLHRGVPLSNPGRGRMLSQQVLPAWNAMDAGAAIERIGRLQVDEPLLAMLDICNPHDHNAVAVRTVEERTLIGYVPRYLANDVRKNSRRLQRRFTGCVRRTAQQGRATPTTVALPIRACWPAEFKPCSDVSFQPIPTDVPACCPGMSMYVRLSSK